MAYLNGIDVSNWQKGINLAAVPADFVICKATQGTTYAVSYTHLTLPTICSV